MREETAASKKGRRDKSTVRLTFFLGIIGHVHHGVLVMLLHLLLLLLLLALLLLRHGRTVHLHADHNETIANLKQKVEHKPKMAVTL